MSGLVDKNYHWGDSFRMETLSWVFHGEENRRGLKYWQRDGRREEGINE